MLTVVHSEGFVRFGGLRVVQPSGGTTINACMARSEMVFNMVCVSLSQLAFAKTGRRDDTTP